MSNQNHHRKLLSTFKKLFFVGLIPIIFLISVELLPPVWEPELLFPIILIQILIMVIIIYSISFWISKQDAMKRTSDPKGENKYGPIILSLMKSKDKLAESDDIINQSIFRCGVDKDVYLIPTIISIIFVIMICGSTLLSKRTLSFYLLIIVTIFLLSIIIVGYPIMIMKTYRLAISDKYLLWPLPSPGNPLAKSELKIDKSDIASISIILHSREDKGYISIKNKKNNEFFARISFSNLEFKEFLLEFERHRFAVNIIRHGAD